MTRLATPFVTSGDLIIVSVLVTGPRGTLPGRFVLDTGAAVTTMTHALASSIGYGPRDGFRRTKVHTAIRNAPRFHSVFYFFGNTGYEALRTRMYARRNKLLPGASALEIARYDRCQVRWASCKESKTRLGPSGKEVKWQAPTQSTIVRSASRSQILEWTWSPTQPRPASSP